MRYLNYECSLGWCFDHFNGPSIIRLLKTLDYTKFPRDFQQLDTSIKQYAKNENLVGNPTLNKDEMSC